ncbi:DUF2972 domain-containing protein [Campylobacter molothri]|uniref:DUF2972 domain-containing protein n=1 Tax=Campylobacter molothri TaxID=1032242 RepID=UPI0039F23A3B
MNCLRRCNVNIPWPGWIQGIQRYNFYFDFLRSNTRGYNVLHWGEALKDFSDNYKLAALIAKDCYHLIIFRDPISVFASCLGYEFYKIENDDVILPSDNDFCIGEYVFTRNNIFSSNIDHIFNILFNCFCQKNILDYFQKKLKTIIIGSDEISRINTFSTLTKLSKILNFDSPKVEDKFYFESKLSFPSNPIFQYFPLKIQFKEFKIEFKIDAGCWIDTKELQSNIFKKVFYLGDILLDIKMINKLNRYLTQNEINYMENLLTSFLENIELRINNIKKNKVIEEDVLRLLKVNLDYRNKLNNIIKNNLSYIKQHRPDIVASWKYYQEFEKMCEELDGESKIKQIENNSN